MDILSTGNGQIKWTSLIERAINVITKMLGDTFEELTHPDVDVLRLRNNDDEYIFGTTT